MLSKGRLLARDLPKELDAALLGRFDHLSKGSVDGQHFAKAFGAQAGNTWWEDFPPQGPLGFAAKAVSLDRRGEPDAAIPLYRKVASDDAPWVRLLGHLLMGWSNAFSELEPIYAAAGWIRELRRHQRKARLLAKLSGFASDKGDLEFGQSLWQDAINASDSKTQLGRALRIEGVNLGFGIEDTDLFKKPSGEVNDDLVWPEEVERLQSASASNTLTQAIEDEFGGTWRHTIRMGITPLDEVDTAEAQARWIGAPWLRRPIRKQMGAQLLAGAAESPEQWAHGVVTWTLGSASQPRLALEYAEPHFNHSSADYIVSAVADTDPTRSRYHRLAELGAEAWDLLSDPMLLRLASLVEPATGQGSPGPESRLIWAGLAIRIPRAWFEKYRTLDERIRATLLDSLNPVALRHFDEEMKTAMYQALSKDDVVLAERGRLLPLLAALTPNEDDPRLLRLANSDQPLSPRVIHDLMRESSGVVTRATETRVITELTSSLVKQSADARAGKVGLGGPGPGLELGRFLSGALAVPRSAVEVLVETATDPTLPPQYLMEARQGLLLLRRARKLKALDIKRLRSAPEPPESAWISEGITNAVLRILLLQILAEATTVRERTELVAAVRSQEERVRYLAVNACAEALQFSSDDSLAWAVVSGLFDPSDSVAGGALSGLRPLTKSFKAAAEVAWERLPLLFEASSRRVRTEVINALGYTPPRTRKQREWRTGLLARARHDRSWLVRSAVEEVLRAN